MLIGLLSKSTRLEAMLKRIAYLSPGLNKKLKKLYYKLRGEAKKPEKDPAAFDKLFEKIDTFGINKGDILLVHSSMDGLAKCTASPAQYINRLLELVGEEGTLVFPAYPITNRPDLFERKSDEIPLYDPKTTPSWTGLLPNVFCMYPGVIRSECPHNTLAAKGKEAEAMMKDNFLAEYPQGEHTAWDYCIRHHAKVLYLGVEMARSNTLFHAVEDRMGDEWPIADWYEYHEYRVKRADGSIETKRIGSSKPMWVKYSAPHHTLACLEKQGILYETNVDGISLGFIPDANAFIEQVTKDTRNGKIRYVVPRKYLKKNQSKRKD